MICSSHYKNKVAWITACLHAYSELYKVLLHRYWNAIKEESLIKLEKYKIIFKYIKYK